MGRRPQRWDPAEHSSEEIDLRNQELLFLDRAEDRLVSLMTLANRQGCLEDAVLHKAKRALKRFDETRRRGPDAIRGLLKRTEGVCTELLHRIETQLGPVEDFRDPEEPAATLIDPGLAPGECVGAGPSLGEERARVRARIVAPVLTREKKARVAAEEWQEIFRKALAGEPSVVVRDVPEELWADFAHVHPSTVSGWAKKVRTARAEALEKGGPLPSDMEILRHTQPKETVASQRKRTPELIQDILLALVNDSTQSSADLAKQFGDVSSRTIRRAMRKDIAPAVLGLLKGGPEAREEIFYSRLPRRPERPMEVLQIDDSSVQVAALVKRYEPNLRDFDFGIQCILRVPGPGGRWGTERLERIYVQAIVDAYSRYKLIHRLFPSPPTAADTLVTLALAALRFGLPDTLYSDNGADFTATLVKRKLEVAGVRQVFCSPGRPRGRGIVEAWFRDLKKWFFSKCPGFGDSPWPEDLLPYLDDLERTLNAFVEGAFNRQYHKAIGMSPWECMHRSFAGPALSDPKRIFQLFPTVTVTKEGDGLHYRNGLYRCDNLILVPKGASVNLHVVPHHFDQLWISWCPDGKRVDFLGEGRRTDDADPAPQIGATRRAEMAALRAVAGPALALLEEKGKAVRRVERQVRTERQAAHDAARMVEQALEDARRGSLPSQSEGPEPPTPEEIDPEHRFLRF